MLLNIIYLLAGFIILVYGANLLVDGGAALAHRLKVPNIVIGLTVVAFGTSTPELVVNIISSIEGSSALALGNVLGSNIFNIMAILGVTALFVPIGIKRSTTWIEIPLAVLAAVLILILANGEPSKIITLKLAHVPEGRHIFPQMTVEENLEMGAFTDPTDMAKTMADVYERFPRLKERKRQLAGTLSGGEQQMLAVGRALMGKPKMILMDEPSMGLSPLLVKEIFAIIKEVNKQGITILLVEQNAKMALAISDRAYVLETGNITLSGDAQELLNDARVKKAYLGQ